MIVFLLKKKGYFPGTRLNDDPDQKRSLAVGM
jgi:hypothetical protein